MNRRTPFPKLTILNYTLGFQKQMHSRCTFTEIFSLLIYPIKTIKESLNKIIPFKVQQDYPDRNHPITVCPEPVEELNHRSLKDKNAALSLTVNKLTNKNAALNLYLKQLKNKCTALNLAFKKFKDRSAVLNLALKESKKKNITLNKLNRTLKNKNVELKSRLKSLQLRQPSWIKFLSSSALFAENTVEALVKSGFTPDIAIGRHVTSLEALLGIKQAFNCKLFLDAVEYTELIESTSPAFRTFSPVGLKIIQERIDALIANLDGIFTVGPALATALSQRHEREVLIITNARETAALERSMEIRHKIAASNNDVVCVFPNLITDESGFENVAKAFVHLPPQFKLVHVGRISTEVKKHLDSLLTDKILLGRISMLGEVPYNAVPTLLSGADLGIICLIPLHKNIKFSLPNRLHDLVAAGVPIFSTNIQDINEYVKQRRLGAIFENNQPETIANTILSHLEDLPQYRRNVAVFRAENIWENQFNILLAALPEDASSIVYIAQKNISDNGRTHRIVRSLVKAGKDVRIVAPIKKSTCEVVNSHLLFASDGRVFS